MVQSAAEADAEHLKHQIELTQTASHIEAEHPKSRLLTQAASYREAEHLRGQIEAVKEAGFAGGPAPSIRHRGAEIDTLWRMLASLTESSQTEARLERRDGAFESSQRLAYIRESILVISRAKGFYARSRTASDYSF